MAKKSFKPQSLRTILGFLIVAVTLGGGTLFYYGLEQVKAYAISVNERLEDAEASDEQIQQLQVLKNQLAQSKQLVAKADKMFANSNSYQTQALSDIRNYSEQVGIEIAATDFENSEDGSNIVIIKLANPTNYPKLIQFLTLLEGNLPKMQVTSIETKYVPGGDADAVEVGDIKINVSVR